MEFYKIQVFGELEVFEKSGSSLSCRSRENHGAQHIAINFLSKPQAQGGPSHLFHHLPRNLKEVCANHLLRIVDTSFLFLDAHNLRMVRHSLR